MKDITFAIEPDGSLWFVYSDAARPLLALGPSACKRVSHVEPAPGGLWTADMAPAGGPVLGPFEARSEALDAELAWLSGHPDAVSAFAAGILQVA